MGSNFSWHFLWDICILTVWYKKNRHVWSLEKFQLFLHTLDRIYLLYPLLFWQIFSNSTFLLYIKSLEKLLSSLKWPPPTYLRLGNCRIKRRQAFSTAFSILFWYINQRRFLYYVQSKDQRRSEGKFTFLIFTNVCILIIYDDDMYIILVKFFWIMVRKCCFVK